MPTAGSLMQNVRIQVGDPDRDFLTDTLGMEWLSQSEQKLCDRILALDEIKDYTLVAKKMRYDLPTNYIAGNTVMWFKNSNMKMEYQDPSIWDSLMESTLDSTGTPEYWTVIRNQLVVGQSSPSANSATSTASGIMYASTTTISLTAASGTFRSRGWVLIGTEVIEYTGVATTTLTGCVRGIHGTTIASAASAAQVTEIDMQLRYRKMPTEITATTQFPDTPYIWHKYLEKYTMYLYYLARGDTAKAEVVYGEFDEMVASAQKTVGRRAIALHRIRDKRHSFRWW